MHSTVQNRQDDKAALTASNTAIKTENYVFIYLLFAAKEARNLSVTIMHYSTTCIYVLI